MDIYVGDQIRMCGGCNEWRHITQFEVGRKYCRVCFAASMKRLNDALTGGFSSQNELILPHGVALELARPLTPDDGVAYTVADDVPDLTADELNMRAMGIPEWEWEDRSS